MPRPRRWRGARATGCAALVALLAASAAPVAGPAGAQPAPPAATAPARAPASAPAAPKPYVLLFDWGPGAAAEAALQLRLNLEPKGRFRLALRAEAIERLKASATVQKARADAAVFTDAGRAAEMGLQWAAAEAAYRRALDALDEAVVRLFDPELVARLHLALGAVAFHQEQRTAAHDEFRRALSLWPTLEPEKSYNPQVRAAFDVARGKVPPGKGPKAPPPAPVPPAPPPTVTEVGRLAAAAGAGVVVVVEEEAAAGRQALRASLYSAARRAYVAVETRALAGGAPAAVDHEALAGRVLEALDGLFPPPRAPQPATQAATQPATQKLPPPPPPPPWYKRWWLWTIVGAVVVTSVSVPVLVLRRDTVGLAVTY
jgi:tetratricopeptide (TPR) repeat protein